MSDLDPSERNPWRRIEARVVFESRYFRVRHDRVVAPDGTPVDYPFIDYRVPVVTIAPVTVDGRIYLVRQWRYPWEASSWELPAGHCEPGEAPAEAARRELLEEAGLVAAEWQELPFLRPGASLTACFHPFIARDLAPVPTAREATEADMEVRVLPLVDAVEAALRGDIRHAVSVAVLLQVARRLGV